MNVSRFRILLTYPGGAAGTNARDEATVLAHIVGELGRIEDDADVEEREEDDQRDVDQV